MKYCLSVFDIYGTDTPKVPEGYKLTGEFRPPNNEEWYLSRAKGSEAIRWFGSSADLPRLILEKLPPPPTIEFIYGTKEPQIPEGYESTGELRTAKRGDIFLSERSRLAVTSVVDYMDDGPHPRLILRKVKIYSDAEILAHILENLTEGTRYGRWEIWRSESIKSIKNRIIAHMREDGK